MPLTDKAAPLRRIAALTAIVVSVALTGCVREPLLGEDAEIADLIKTYRQESARAADERIRDEATSIRRLAVERRGDGASFVSADLNDAPVARVVNTILDRAGTSYNLAGIRLTGRVTLRFSELPLLRALNEIVNPSGVSVAAKDGILAFRYGGPVAPVDIAASDSRSGAAATDGSTDSTAQESGVVYEEVLLNHLDAPDALTLLTSLFSNPDDSSDDTSVKIKFGSVDDLNTIYLAGTAAEVSAALGVLRRSDREVPHVLIEAIVVDMESEAAAKLGAQLTDFANGRFSGGNFSPSAGSFSLNFLQAANLPLSLAASIDLLVSQGKAQILTRPYIVARSRQQASIEVVEEQFVTVQTTQDGAALTTADGISAGVMLSITPTVMPENNLRIDLKLERSQFIPVGGNNSLLAKDRNTASSSVTVADGQTIIVGGLKSKLLSSINAGLPWLRKIPLLDFFAAGRTGRELNTEVVLYLTPHIWEPGMDLPIHRQNIPSIENRILAPFERFDGGRPATTK